MPAASHFSPAVGAHRQVGIVVYALLVALLLAATTVAALGVASYLSQ